MKLHLNLIRMHEGNLSFSYLMVNGLPGIRIRLGEGAQYVYSFDYRDHKIEAIYNVANPEKLRHL